MRKTSLFGKIRCFTKRALVCAQFCLYIPSNHYCTPLTTILDTVDTGIWKQQNHLFWRSSGSPHATRIFRKFSKHLMELKTISQSENTEQHCLCPSLHYLTFGLSILPRAFQCSESVKGICWLWLNIFSGGLLQFKPSMIQLTSF